MNRRDGVRGFAGIAWISPHSAKRPNAAWFNSGAKVPDTRTIVVTPIRGFGLHCAPTRTHAPPAQSLLPVSGRRLAAKAPASLSQAPEGSQVSVLNVGIGNAKMRFKEEAAWSFARACEPAVLIMPIRFRCAYCNQLLGIARRKSGTVVRCPTCAGHVVVPNLPAEEAENAEKAPDSVFERSDFDELLSEPRGQAQSGEKKEGESGWLEAPVAI